MLYLLQGNSNSLSSVDVSAGYVGLVEMNKPLIALLMVISTYAGPLLWISNILIMFYELESRGDIR